jgi:predicted nucleotidyltransferase
MGRLMWVFGSVARGVVDDSSDIDLLVDDDLQKINLGSQRGYSSICKIY